MGITQESIKNSQEYFCMFRSFIISGIFLLLIGCKAEKPIEPPPVIVPVELPTKELPVIELIEPENIRLIETAEKYLHVRETNGFNRSPDIDKWNEFTKAPLGSAYCASFLAWAHHETGIKAPVTAWSPSFVTQSRIPFEDIQPGDVAGLYFPSKGRIAHVLMITGQQGAYIKTVEANTSPQANSLEAKSREGDGVYNKLRSRKLMSDNRNRFSRYWKK